MQKAYKRNVSELFSIWALSWGQVDDVGQILLSVTLVWISVELLWIYTDVAEKKTCPVSFLSSVTVLLNPGLHLRPASSYKLPDHHNARWHLSADLPVFSSEDFQAASWILLEKKEAQEVPCIFWVQSFSKQVQMALPVPQKKHVPATPWKLEFNVLHLKRRVFLIFGTCEKLFFTKLSDKTLQETLIPKLSVWLLHTSVSLLSSRDV